MSLNLKQFVDLASKNPTFITGCVVDTNILFGAAYPSDRLNTWAEKFFELCRTAKIPVYSNINIRAEFMDLFRRALIVESLLTIRAHYKEELTPDLERRLKALDQRVNENIKKNVSTQLSERDIKEYRKALLEVFPAKSSDGSDLWKVLCRDFLGPQLEPVWKDTTDTLGINFAGSRVTDSSTLFNTSPEWDGAISIMGQSAMGSSDAMIANFFLCSKFTVLVTADIQVAEHVEQLISMDRVIVVPAEDEML